MPAPNATFVAESPTQPPSRSPTAPKTSSSNSVPSLPPPSKSPASTLDLSSWAAVSKKPGNTSKDVNVAPKKQAPPKYMLFNTYDERLDAELPRADANAVQRLFDRIKVQKVCNPYHLTGKCDKEGYCDYHHAPRLSPGEQLALRHHARKRSCPRRSDCFDFDCTFGHVCAYGRDCSWEETCYFSAVHHVDKTPAYKYYENGKKESVTTG